MRTNRTPSDLLFIIRSGKFVALLILALALNLSPAWADEADDAYLSILSVIQRADTMHAGGQAEQALAKYREARTALNIFQTNYPEWNKKVVSFRLDYITQKINDLTAKPEPAEPGAAATGSTPVARAAGAASSAPQLKLLEAGAEPRKVLRLHPQAGDKQSLAVNIKMVMDIQMGEVQSQSMKLPAMILPVDLSVQSVSPQGDITYNMVLGEATVADEPGTLPQIAETLKSALSSCKGLAGTGKMSNRGLSGTMDIKMPAEADPQTRKTMEQMKDSFSKMGIQLPEEAVGVGAKWEVRMPIQSQGMTLDQTTVYELVAREGDRCTAKTTITQRAGNQKIESPAMPGLKVDLTKMTGQGTGEVVFDLGKLTPVNGKSTVHTEMAMGMNLAGQKQSMAMKMDMDVHLESK